MRLSGSRRREKGVGCPFLLLLAISCQASRGRLSSGFIAGVAQVGEQLICNQQVGGSSPLASSLILMGSCPSGQWEQTVNLPAHAYGGSNPPLPTIYFELYFEFTRRVGAEFNLAWLACGVVCC